MNAAGQLFKSADRNSLFAAAHNPKLQEQMSTYVNASVRSGVAPTVKGLLQHVQARAQKHLEGLKTARGREGKTAEYKSDVDTIKNHAEGLENLLKIHQHFTAAKHALLPALERASTTGYSHSINGRVTGPEGFVAVTKENRPTKLINRGEGGFAQQNLLKGGFKNAKV